MTAPAAGREPAGSGFELALAVVGGAVCVVVGIVAGGAWLALRLTGGSLSGGLAEWLSVAGRLASEPGDPAAAWGDLAMGIPGPAIYWACTAVVLAAALAWALSVGGRGAGHGLRHGRHSAYRVVNLHPTQWFLPFRNQSS